MLQPVSYTHLDTKEALLQAQQAGARLALISRRSPQNLKKIAEKLQMNTYKGYIAACHGAFLQEMGSERVPVSYTHLDVYKRQDLDNPNGNALLWFLMYHNIFQIFDECVIFHLAVIQSSRPA